MGDEKANVCLVASWTGIPSEKNLKRPVKVEGKQREKVSHGKKRTLRVERWHRLSLESA